MESRALKVQMGKRYLELRGEGKSGEDAASAVKAEFNSTAKDSTIRGYGSKYKKIQDKSTGTFIPPAKAPTSTPKCLSKNDNFAKILPDTWREEVDKMIQDALAKAIGDLSTVANVAKNLEEPPTPEREDGSKKYKAEFERVRIAGTVPKGLLAIFEQYRKAKGKNASQMLEFILHNFFKQNSSLA